jgi:hypothetical protein
MRDGSKAVAALSLLSALAAAPAGAGAQASSASAPAPTLAPVSDEQVRDYQLGLESGCRRVARKRGETAAVAERYCACVMKVLHEHASAAQWRQATAAMLQNRPREEALAFSEHTLRFQGCKSPP